jgi:hypothetical protein
MFRQALTLASLGKQRDLFHAQNYQICFVFANIFSAD